MAQHGGNIRVENWHKHGNNWRKCSLLFTNWQTDTIEQKQIIIICSLSFKCFSIFQAKNQLFFSKPILVHHDRFIFLSLPLKCSKLWFHREQSWLCGILQFSQKMIFKATTLFWYSFVIAQGQEFLKKFLNIRVLNFTSRFFCLLRYAN